MFKLTVWYLWHTLKNAVKRAWKVVLVIAIITAVVIGIAFIAAKLIPEDEKEQEAEKPAEVNIIDLEAYALKYENGFALEEDDNGMYLFEYGEYHEIGSLLVSAIVGLVIMLFIAIGIMKGAKNGASIFIMPDVNFLFPSPRTPQSLLMFRMIGQLGISLLGAFYMLGQLPNLMMNAGLGVGGAVMLFIVYGILQFVSTITSVLTYVLLQKHDRIKKFLSKYAIFLTALPVVVAVAVYYIGGTSIYTAAYMVFQSPASMAFPVWGWLTAAGSFAFSGDILMSVAFTVAALVGAVIMTLIAWRVPCDFYEDALESAARVNDMQQEALEQAAGGIKHGVHHEGKREQKKWDKRRNNEIAFTGYDGAKVFFAKTMLNRKRMNSLWGFWSSSSSAYFWAVVGCGAAMKYMMEVGSGLAIAVSCVGIVIVFMFFRSFFNPLQVDLGQNFIYLVPEKPSALLFWDMLGQMIDGAIDLIPAFAALVFFTLDPVLSVCMYLLLISMHLFFGMTALMVNLVVAGYLPLYFSNMLQTIVRLIPFLPVVIIFSMGIASGSPVLPILFCVLINVCASLLAFLPCPYHLHKGKR